MIIVTGTKRSGTSMWMQILIAAGFTPFGEQFPKDWKQKLGDANPSGFYETSLRHGIYYKTNPHPKDGAYFFPEQVQRHVVKVFIPGLARSDRAFIGRVIGTVREWREYEASVTRLWQIEDESRLKKNPQARIPQRMPAALEWWNNNITLIRDIAIRRYPARLQSYDGVMEDPEKVIGGILAWMGGKGMSITDAVTAVKPVHRTQENPEPSSATVSGEYAQVFDELYNAVRCGDIFDRNLIRKLNAYHQKLVPLIREHQQRVNEDAAARHASQSGESSVWEN